MNDKKTQKAAAIGIGLVLSLLLVYIGFRVVQKRGSQAGVVENFRCEPRDANPTQTECSWSSNNEEVGRVLYASMPPGGLKECNLVFISEELATPVALGDGNFEHRVILQPLVADQAYCAAPAGNEDTLVEIPPATAGAGASTGSSDVVLDVTPTTPVVVETSPAVDEPTTLPTTAPQPTASPATTDADIDAYYNDADNAGSDWGDCLDYFSKKGQQISSNACIRGYMRHTSS